MRAATLIIQARKRAGLTQAELARRLGTHQPVVARWEAGRSQPDFATLQRIVHAAGFELAVGITPADDHDTALIRRELALPPHRRLAGMIAATHAFEAMARTARG